MEKAIKIRHLFIYLIDSFNLTLPILWKNFDIHLFFLLYLPNRRKLNKSKKTMFETKWFRCGNVFEFSNGSYLTHNLHHIPFNCRPNWSHGLFSNTHIICRLTMAWLFSNLLMVLSSARTVQFSIFDNKITSKKPQIVWRIFPFILNCC